jgi:C4-dicarboxylate-specific signal transduction histidine kinase
MVRRTRGRELIYATGRDVTDLKRAEEQLQILRRELADASRQATVGVMTASLAHEIKQPLTAIVTNASAGLRWLKGSDPNLARAQSNLDHIVKAGIQLGEVIDSTRAMFGKESAERDPLDIRLLVSNVLALARGELVSHQIVLRNEMGERLLQVMAARVQLQQVILNLDHECNRSYELGNGSGAASHYRISPRSTGNSDNHRSGYGNRN